MQEKGKAIGLLQKTCVWIKQLKVVTINAMEAGLVIKAKVLETHEI